MCGSSQKNREKGEDRGRRKTHGTNTQMRHPQGRTEWQRGETEIEEQIRFFPLRHGKLKASKPPAAFEKPAQPETRKGMQELEHKMNKLVHAQNEMLSHLESLITGHQMQQRTEVMYQQFMAKLQENASGKWRITKEAKSKFKGRDQ